MKSQLAIWLEFGSIVVATGAVILCMFFFMLGVRWQMRKKRMEKVLQELRRDPQMVICAEETKTMLDCKVGEFRRDVMS